MGWMMGQPMDLNFHLFETASLLINVLVVAFLLLVRKLHNLHFENLLFHSCQIRLFKKLSTFSGGDFELFKRLDANFVLSDSGRQFLCIC
jgi:hypothetical protein